jgi:hypothetical protein
MFRIGQTRGLFIEFALRCVVMSVSKLMELGSHSQMWTLFVLPKHMFIGQQTLQNPGQEDPVTVEVIKMQHLKF